MTGKVFVDSNIAVYAADYRDARDALIVTAAESANCAQICSEDLNGGQAIRSMRIWKPFT